MQGLTMRAQTDPRISQVCTCRNHPAEILQWQIRHPYVNFKVALIYLLQLHLA